MSSICGVYDMRVKAPENYIKIQQGILTYRAMLRSRSRAGREYAHATIVYHREITTPCLFRSAAYKKGRFLYHGLY